MSVTITGCCTLLQVFDMPRSISFYRDIMGFAVVDAFPAGDDCDWCRLRRGSVELMLNTQFERSERPDHPNPERALHHADTCLYLACPELDAAYDWLRSQCLAVDPPVTREYGMRQLSLLDPDGYGLCLQWPAE